MQISLQKTVQPPRWRWLEFNNFSIQKLMKKLAYLLPICVIASTQSLAFASNIATTPVIKAIEARDCVAAARELNLALEGATPESFALAGVMFETGLCLKANLERAFMSKR